MDDINIEGKCILCGTPVFSDKVKSVYKHATCEIAYHLGGKSAYTKVICWKSNCLWCEANQCALSEIELNDPLKNSSMTDCKNFTPK